MKTIEMKLPEIGLLAVTRVVLGVGAGLLLSAKLNREQRRAVGLALLLVGLVTTAPFAVHVLSKD